MNKTNMMAMTVALLFVAAAVAAPANADQQEREFSISIGEPSLGDHPGGAYEEDQCDGQLALIAADVPGCMFDEHTVGSFGYIILGFKSVNAGNTGPIPLTGSVTAHLTHDGGEVIFTCTWNGGTFQGCQIGSAVWPNPGDTFEFDCYSEAGSLGGWGECYVGHY